MKNYSFKSAAESGGQRQLLAVLVSTFLAILVAVLVLSVWQTRAEAATTSQKLNSLTVRSAGSMTGYDRDKFDHWSNAEDYGWTIPSFVRYPGSCDARDAALIRDGRGQERTSGYCDVDSGKWVDPYAGGTYTNPSDIDIDHMVPLANAWRSGASRWTDAQRERFANVPSSLLAVDDGQNASKGDRGPEAWKPPRAAYHCTYATKWVNVKHTWKLSVTSSEKSALRQMLSTCR